MQVMSTGDCGDSVLLSYQPASTLIVSMNAHRPFQTRMALTEEHGEGQVIRHCVVAVDTTPYLPFARTSIATSKTTIAKSLENQSHHQASSSSDRQTSRGKKSSACMESVQYSVVGPRMNVSLSNRLTKLLMSCCNASQTANPAHHGPPRGWCAPAALLS